MILAIIKLEILLKLPTAMQPDKEESMKSAGSEIAHVANHLNAELNKAVFRWPLNRRRRIQSVHCSYCSILFLFGNNCSIVD